jgi:peptide/nickel transport system substrate-binding protein
MRRVALEAGVIIPCFLSRNFILSKNTEGELFKWEMPVGYTELSKNS